LCALTGASSRLAAQEPAAPAAAEQPPAAEPSSEMWMRKGELAASDRAGDVELKAGKTHAIPGGVLSIPLGRGHQLKFSYFQTKGAGNNTAGVDLNLFGGDYDKGTYLATQYKVQNGKVALEYTSWPFPIDNRKFRLKTYWGVQYVSVKASIDAPLKPVAEGETNATEGSRWFIYPSLGGGIEYRASRNFRFETGGSGFYIPGRPNVWDANATATVRAGKVEFMFGAKAFHFQTSRKPEEFFRGTFAGVFAGVGYRFE
jgi:hypothetical protein